MDELQERWAKENRYFIIERKKIAGMIKEDHPELDAKMCMKYAQQVIDLYRLPDNLPEWLRYYVQFTSR